MQRKRATHLSKKNLKEIYQNEKTDYVEIRPNDGTCIPEFTPVMYSLITDKYAQCKLTYSRNETFEEMNDYFAEENSYVKNHTSAFIMPSLASLQAEGNLTENQTNEILEKFANLNLYREHCGAY